jgi:DNA-binding MarR family transcriptional regulator
MSSPLPYPAAMSRSGADLALLLLGGFRSLVEDATDELAQRGYEDVRPVHDFAMRAIAAGADNASELGRRLSVSKQAAAKTIAVLQERGYVARDADPLDARRKRLQVTALGFEVLRQGEAIFDELRDRWERQIGSVELESLETHLAAVVGASPIRFDTAGWMTRDLGEPA